MNEVGRRRSSVASTSILEAPSCQSYGERGEEGVREFPVKPWEWEGEALGCAEG